MELEDIRSYTVHLACFSLLIACVLCSALYSARREFRRLRRRWRESRDRMIAERPKERPDEEEEAPSSSKPRRIRRRRRAAPEAPPEEAPPSPRTEAEAPPSPRAEAEAESPAPAKSETIDCVVCLVEPRGALFPCGHVCCCLECARELRICPMCRSPTPSWTRVFL